MRRIKVIAGSVGALGFALAALPMGASAQVVLPGSADAARIQPEKAQPPAEMPKDLREAPKDAPAVQVPEGAEKIFFELKEIKIEGNTVFSQEQLRDIYASKLGTKVSLKDVYEMAGEITRRYREEGYFLSQASLPAQEVAGGVVVIQVIEGYIGRAQMPKNVEAHYTVRSYIKDIMAQRPLKIQELESLLLRLNDIPGYDVKGVLSPMESAQDGAVLLTLQATDEVGRGQLSFDNYSSKFLGPNQFTVNYSDSFLPMHKSAVAFLVSKPYDKMKYLSANHDVLILPDLTLGVSGALTKSRPGHTLEPLDIISDSNYVSASISYQWIRQRLENLVVKLMLDARNTASDILGTALTRDNIRAVRLNVAYDTADRWEGYNIANFTLSRGISGLGASEKDDLNLSRAQARPDFYKAEASLTRQQYFNSDWSMMLSASAQLASGPLYSAEEFGYGGQSFGRAFDSSEITGDHGIAGSIEIRYHGFANLQPIGLQPYVFYDIGKIWNRDFTQIDRESGASAGFGLRAEVSELGISGNLGLAWPLTREISTPIYGQDDSGPRIMVQVSKSF